MSARNLRLLRMRGVVRLSHSGRANANNKFRNLNATLLSRAADWLANTDVHISVRERVPDRKRTHAGITSKLVGGVRAHAHNVRVLAHI